MHFDYRNSDLDDKDLDYDGRSNEGERWDVDGKSIGNDEFEMRRARIGIKGKLDGVWKYDVCLTL